MGEGGVGERGDRGDLGGLMGVVNTCGRWMPLFTRRTATAVVRPRLLPLLLSLLFTTVLLLRFTFDREDDAEDEERPDEWMGECRFLEEEDTELDRRLPALLWRRWIRLPLRLRSSREQAISTTATNTMRRNKPSVTHTVVMVANVNSWRGVKIAFDLDALTFSSRNQLTDHILLPLSVFQACLNLGQTESLCLMTSSLSLFQASTDSQAYRTLFFSLSLVHTVVSPPRLQLLLQRYESAPKTSMKADANRTKTMTTSRLHSLCLSFDIALLCDLH
jgi:hypothetical protein